MKLENRLLSFLEARQLESDPAPLLVGVSGGRDSMTLLRLLVEVRDRLPGDPPIVPVHFNHRLHDRAERASRLVLDRGRHWGLDPVRGCLRDPSDLGEDRLGPEAAARRERFEFFESVAETLGARALLLAHHRRDGVETILINAGRGTGLYGLAGIQEVTSTRGGLPLWRPLLEVDPGDLHEWGDARDVPWVEDPTNRDLHYARNRIRTRILPEWDRAQPDPQTALFRLSRRAALENDFWDQYLEETFEYRRWESEIQVDLTVFENQHPAARFRFLHSLPRRLGVGGHGWSERNYRDLHELFTRSESGRQISLPGDLRALREYDRGVLVVGNLESPSYRDSLFPQPGSRSLPGTGELHLEPPGGSGDPSPLRSPLPGHVSPDLRLRTWEDGDRTREGTSLKTIFDRHRIPYRARRRWPLFSVRGDVICIPGLYPDQPPDGNSLVARFEPDHPCFEPVGDE